MNKKKIVVAKVVRYSKQLVYTYLSIVSLFY